MLPSGGGFGLEMLVRRAVVALRLVYLVFILLGAALACRIAWEVLPGLWRWLVTAFIAYTVRTTPYTIARMFRTYWSAARAAEENRALLKREPVAT